MTMLTTWMLTATMVLTPMLGGDFSRRIDVDCESEPDLQRVLTFAPRRGPVDIYLHGVCEGNFVITLDGVTLRGATPESGLAAPSEGRDPRIVLEIIDARTSLRGMVVRGGEAGILVRGWDADLFLFEADVHDREGVGVMVSRGAQLHMRDSTVRDGSLGILVEDDSYANLQNVVVDNHETGMVVVDESSATLNDTTIENNLQGGLNVADRSDVTVWRGAFRENAQVHVNANDWSGVTLVDGTEIGSETDPTTWALTVARQATIKTYTTPAIYGDLGALTGGSIWLGNTVVDGDLVVREFSRAHVRDAEITGVVFCADGSDAICRRTTTGGAFDCPSPTCGSEPPATSAREPSPTEVPGLEPPSLERLRPSRSRRSD